MPFFDKYKHPPTSQKFYWTLLTPRITDTQNIDSIFCVSFTDQMYLSFYVLFQKQHIYFLDTKLD